MAVIASATAVTAISMVSMSVASCQFPVSSQFPVASCQLPVSSFQFPVSFQLPVNSFSLRAATTVSAGSWKLEAGSSFLSQFELHRDLNHHVNRCTETSCWRKPPLFHGVNGALIESAAKTAEEPNVTDRTVRPNDDLELNIP